MYSFDNEYKAEIVKWMPNMVSINNLEDPIKREFKFDADGIIKFAQTEGFLVYSSLKNIPDNVNKLCVVSNGEISFYKRVFWKNQPTPNFHSHMDSDNPCFYSSRRIFYCQNGELHRVVGPSYLDVHEIIWNVNGKWHRDGNEPSYINSFKGLKFHHNHECWKKIDKDGINYFHGWRSGIGVWTPVKNEMALKLEKTKE